MGLRSGLWAGQPVCGAHEGLLCGSTTTQTSSMQISPGSLFREVNAQVGHHLLQRLLPLHFLRPMGKGCWKHAPLTFLTYLTSFLASFSVNFLGRPGRFFCFFGESFSFNSRWIHRMLINFFPHLREPNSAANRTRGTEGTLFAAGVHDGKDSVRLHALRGKEQSLSPFRIWQGSRHSVHYLWV